MMTKGKCWKTMVWIRMNMIYKTYILSAIHGFYEGMYKLADMFINGYGCRERNRTACTLYQMVYDDCINRFLKGPNFILVGAALRMQRLIPSFFLRIQLIFQNSKILLHFVRAGQLRRYSKRSLKNSGSCLKGNFHQHNINSLQITGRQFYV